MEVMLSPLPCWGTGDMGHLGNPQRRKYDSSTGSSEDVSSFHELRPPLKSTRHIRLPPISVGDKNPLFSPVKGFEETNDSDEVFNAVPKKIVLSDISNKNIIEKAFEKFDDPYAKLPVARTPGSPKSPEPILTSPKTPACEQYVPYEIRSAREKALEEGQKEFCQILKKNGIDPNAHFSKVFSSKKKSLKKVNFECSTPKAFSMMSNSNTPLTERYAEIDTPISGVKQLKERNRSVLSPFNLNVTLSPLPACRADLSLNDTLSPVVNLPPDIKATILSGIVCYVDVRTEKENRLESVKAELRSLGAQVEKNFTKKVTHVVFREGRVSTYLKAKKEGIPLVGILWIEACKHVRGIADPAMHPPYHMEKYDDLMPYQTLKKRRIGLLNPNSRVRKNLMMLCGELPLTPLSNKKKSRTRRAITEVKGASKKDEGKTSFERICGKKLVFDGCEEEQDKALANKENDDANLLRVPAVDSSSTDNSAEIKLAAARRRKSAPGKLLSKKNARREDIKAYLKKLQKVEEKENNICSMQTDFEKLTTEDNIIPTQSQDTEKKKRKLFDPSEIFIISQVSENSGASHDEGYLVDLESKPPTPKRARTKATCPAKCLKLSIARKLHQNRNKEHDEDASSPSGLLFVERSPVNIKKKQKPPSIVFTSIPKENIESYAKMVNKLGKFRVLDKVNKTTTHVVSNGPRRTLNIIKGIARGCWLVDVKWLTESNTCGKWLPEENFDLSSHFPAAVECCKERRGLKSARVIDIFKSVGQIYVSRDSSPPWKDLEEILRICSCTITSDPQSADIQVGGKKEPSTSATVVSEKWVLDSITRNSLLPLDDYIES